MNFAAKIQIILGMDCKTTCVVNAQIYFVLIAAVTTMGSFWIGVLYVRRIIAERVMVSNNVTVAPMSYARVVEHMRNAATVTIVVVESA